METAEKIRYWTWCQDKYWQYQRRQEWAYEWRGDTLVRYHELVMPDPDFTKGLLEWLKIPESVHGFEAEGVKYAGCTMYNKQATFEAEWKPVSAWYEQQEGQIDERTKLKIIRVFQALQRNPKDGKGDGPYVVENGCMYKVSHTYYWNVPELPEAPASESGVNYRIGSVARDDETGLWSCYLEKRERVMQELPEYTSDNTGFAARTEQQFLGVKQGAVAETGKKASASDGVTVRRRVKKNEDCTSDVTVETVVDKPVSESSVTVERSLRAETTVIEDKNMQQPLSNENLPVGTRVKNEKTESGLWNRQKTIITPAPPKDPVQESCQKTLFEHSHQKVEVTKEKPTSGDVPNVTSGSGESVKLVVRQLDDGTFEKEEVKQQEQAVEETVVEKRKTLRGTKKIQINRNMPSKASEADLKIGGIVRNEKTPGGRYNQTIETVENEPVGEIDNSIQDSAINTVEKNTQNVAEKPTNDVAASKGKKVSRQVRTTEEGTYDVTEVEDKAKEIQDVVTVGGSEIVEETRTEYRNKETIPETEIGTNKEVSKQERINEYGLRDGSVVVRKHLNKSIEVKSGTVSRKVTSTIERNATKVDDQEGGENEEVDIDISINQHGSLDIRKKIVEYKESTAEEGVESGLYKEDTTKKENSTEQQVVGEAVEGAIVRTTNTPNQHGSYSTVKTTRTAKAKESEEVTWKTKDDNYEYTHSLKVYRNQKTIPTPENGKYKCTVSLSINDYGLYDIVISSTSRSKISVDEGNDGSSNSGKAIRWMSYQKKDGTLWKRKITANYIVRRETGGALHTNMLNNSESGFGFKSEDNGTFGIKYTGITVGNEEEVK